MNASDQSQRATHIRHSLPIQDGVNSDIERGDPAGRLVAETGFEGCLSPCPPSQTPPMLLEVCAQGANVAVQSPTVWPVQCSLNFHKPTETANLLPEKVGDENPTIPRRHAIDGKGQDRSQPQH